MKVVVTPRLEVLVVGVRDAIDPSVVEWASILVSATGATGTVVVDQPRNEGLSSDDFMENLGDSDDVRRSLEIKRCTVSETTDATVHGGVILKLHQQLTMVTLGRVVRA